MILVLFLIIEVQNNNNEKTNIDIVNFLLGNSFLQISKILEFISQFIGSINLSELLIATRNFADLDRGFLLISLMLL